MGGRQSVADDRIQRCAEMLEEAGSNALRLYVVRVGQALCEGEVKPNIVAEDSAVGFQLRCHGRQHLADDCDHVRCAQQPKIREYHLDSLCAALAERVDRLVAGRDDRGVGVFEPRSVYAHSKPLDAILEWGIKGGGWLVTGVWICGIQPCHERIAERDVRDGRAEGAYVGYGPAERRRAMLAYTPKGSLEARDSAERRRDTNRAPSIRADAQGAETCRDRGS